ncbi:hypothetical protein YC2023_061334 [Brassica napus]
MGTLIHLDYLNSIMSSCEKSLPEIRNMSHCINGSKRKICHRPRRMGCYHCHLGDITIHVIVANEERVHEDVWDTLQPSGIRFTHLNSHLKQASDFVISRRLQARQEPILPHLHSPDKR